MHRDDDIFRMSSHRLIDRVVDDFPYEMMETAFIGRSDIHSWSFADWLESFEDLYITAIVGHGESVNVYNAAHIIKKRAKVKLFFG